MRAVDTTMTTDHLRAPPGLSGVSGLPVVFDGRAVASFWQPSPEELAALNAGGLVWLSVLGPAMPPVKLEVLKADVARACAPAISRPATP